MIVKVWKEVVTNDSGFLRFKSGQVKETGISIKRTLIFFNFCGDENHCTAPKAAKGKSGIKIS